MKNRILLAVFLLFPESVLSQTLVPNYHAPLSVRAALVNTSLVQADGKYLVGGDIGFFGAQRVHGILRLNADGSLDNTFDPEVSGDLYVHEIKLQSTGNILVLATQYQAPNGIFFFEASLFKFSPTGELLDQIDDLTSTQRFTVQADDKVLMPGNTLTRYNADFTPDVTFNNAVTFNAQVNDAQQSGNYLFVAGTFSAVNGVPKNDIVKMDLNGVIDNSFDTGTGTNDHVGSLTILANGKILIGRSYINTYNGESGIGGSLRLNADGSRDPSFSLFYSNGPLSNMFVNGNDVYVGSFRALNFVDTKDYLIKLADNGSADLSFPPVELQGFGSIYLSIALGPDGIVISNAHKSASVFGLAKYDYSGNQITSFKPEIGRFGPLRTAERFNDKLYVGGDFVSLDGFTTYGVARLNADGTVDQSFKMQTNLGGAWQIKPLDDGKIFVTTGPSFVKLNSSGDILPEFNWSHFKNLYNVSKFVLRANGKIVVTDPNDAYQLNADGTEDTSFDVGEGIQNIVSTMFDMDLQGDKMLLGSAFSQYRDTPAKQLVRVKTDGTVDATFNTGAGPLDNHNSTCVGLIKVLANNEILVGGRFDKFNNVSVPFSLVKLSPNGALDLAFNENQKLGTGMNGKQVYPLDPGVRTFGSRIFITQKRGEPTGLYVLNPDGTSDEGFNLPATANFVTDLVVPAAEPGPGVATVEMFAVGSFKKTGQQDPISIIKMSVAVQASQTITFNTLDQKSYGNNSTFSLQATSSSGLPVSYTSSDETVATISGSTVTIKGVGSTTITAKQSGNTNYLAAPDVTQSLVIVKANQEITFEPFSPHKPGDDPFILIASSDSGLPITFTSLDETVATINGNEVTIVGLGSTTITARQDGDANYFPADLSRELTVTGDGKLTQNINFAELPKQNKRTDEPLALTATASSGLTVVFSSSNEAVATVAGTTVTIKGVGTTTITASQAGNETYAAASDVAWIMKVVKADQAITFATLPVRKMGDAPFTLSAASSSGLAVQYAVTTDKITVTGTQVSIIKAGKATITAKQPGNEDYNSATPIDRAFCINPAKPVIMTTSLPLVGASTELVSSADAGNQWYADGVAIVGATATQYLPTKDGVYTVRATIEGCASEISDGKPFVINGVGELFNSGLTLYPNPVSSVLYVDLSAFTDGGDVEVSVYNNVGNRVESVRAQRTAELSTIEYASGLYLLHASQNGKTLTAKFIRK